MTFVVSIDSVTTEDAVPVVAPHRISNKPGADVALVAFTPTDDADLYPSDYLLPSDDLLPDTLAGAGTVGFWSLRLGGSSRKTGHFLSGKGMMCGLSFCGLMGPLKADANVQYEEDITYPETGGPADGDYTVNAYAFSTNETAWAT